MDASGDALFPRRYLEEFEKRVSELHGCVERARERAAEARRQDVRLLLDSAGAHEQAATAYQLAGGNRARQGLPGPDHAAPAGCRRQASHGSVTGIWRAEETRQR